MKVSFNDLIKRNWGDRWTGNELEYRIVSRKMSAAELTGNIEKRGYLTRYLYDSAASSLLFHPCNSVEQPEHFIKPTRNVVSRVLNIVRPAIRHRPGRDNPRDSNQVWDTLERKNDAGTGLSSTRHVKSRAHSEDLRVTPRTRQLPTQRCQSINFYHKIIYVCINTDTRILRLVYFT